MQFKCRFNITTCHLGKLAQNNEKWYHKWIKKQGLIDDENWDYGFRNWRFNGVA